ncbi:MAG: hypothetical protein HY259_08425 [Chloroflexi bacterium]|nr:hypothetical protein [Chloroflexota bacterium]
MASRLHNFRKMLAEVLFGMSGHEAVRAYLRTRGSMDHLFMLVTFGDLVGMPIIPPYYSLRLLPFLVPSLQNWKRRLLREKDLIDHIF